MRYERDEALEPRIDPPEGYTPDAVRIKWPGAVEDLVNKADPDQYGIGSFYVETLGGWSGGPEAKEGVLVFCDDVPTPTMYWHPETQKWYPEDDDENPYRVHFLGPKPKEKENVGKIE